MCARCIATDQNLWWDHDPHANSLAHCPLDYQGTLKFITHLEKYL